MKKQNFALGCLAILIAGLASAAMRPAADMAGTWVGNIKFTSEDDDQLTLVLTKSAAGYAGIINDALGFIKKGTPLTDVKAEDKTIRFGFTIIFETGGQSIEMILTLDGDKLAGTLASKEKGSSQEFEFVRKK